MASYEYLLADPPESPRARNLWLQHAAGFILSQDARARAFEKIDPSLAPEAKAAAMKAIDDALFGVMQIIEGVSGSLRNDKQAVSLRMVVRLEEDNEIIEQLDLLDGDGPCTGYVGWREGDFGEDPVARKR